MLALASLSLDSVGWRVPVLNSWFLNFLVDYLINIFSSCTEVLVQRTESTTVWAWLWSVDSKSAFSFVGDFNCHHSEWLVYRVTNAHRAAAIDFATMADCCQLVRGHIHWGGVILDLVLNNVPNLCQVSVGLSVGSLDLRPVLIRASAFPCFQEWIGGVYIV